MLLLAFAAAAQLSAPVPKEIWFNSTDAWSRQLAQHALSTVRLRIVVTPDAKVQSCEIEQSSGDPRFDAHVCDITLKRARFRAATLQDGTAEYGVLRVPVVFTAVPPAWYKRRPRPFEPVGDSRVTADSLPKGKRFPLNLDLAFVVEADGRVSSCAAQGDKQDRTLVTRACREMSTKLRPIPAKGPNGVPVRSVQNGLVIFDKGAAN